MTIQYPGEVKWENDKNKIWSSSDIISLNWLDLAIDHVPRLVGMRLWDEMMVDFISHNSSHNLPSHLGSTFAIFSFYGGGWDQLMRWLISVSQSHDHFIDLPPSQPI